MTDDAPTTTMLLTIDQVAEQLQVHRRTVERAITDRGLRAVQVAGTRTWRIAPADLAAWLDARANTPRRATATPRPAAVPPIIAGAAARARTRGRHSGRLAVTADMGRT